MRDIAMLKERVDYAKRHLKATETARDHESEVLMGTWSKIRERFTHQEGEIARYRAEVESLTDSNQSLSRMVDDLIAVIDGNIERGRDEAVPKITTLAGDLLASEPSPEDLSHFADAAPEAATGQDTDTAGFEDVIDFEQDEDDLAYLDIPGSDDSQDDDLGADRDVAEDSLSPGIRSLIQRVETSVGESDGLSVEADGDGVDDDLARELAEIEMLRSELSGLRDRITAGDA